MPQTPPTHRPIQPLHLAFALDGGEQHRERFEVAHYVELARLAEIGVLDFVTLDDAPPPADGAAGRFDALAVLTQVAPATDRIGLVAAVAAPHPGPPSVPAGIVLLDRISRGRAGWTPPAPDAVASGPSGPSSGTAFAPQDGQDDASAGLHDTASAGTGPTDGWPVIAVDATLEAPRETAARHADVAYVRVGGPHAERLAYEARTDLRRRAAAYGRDPDRLTVLASLAVELFDPADAVVLADLFGDWHRDGITDGFHVRPADPPRDLARLVNGTVPVLQQRGLFRRFQPGTTLREHLGLDRPVSRAVDRSADRAGGRSVG
ncbi:LLM class flavin-dependent oxidoreductase [Streptomyces sp. NPDC006733]|uniref:LLM class flavin-dependent oxidoreductase n=1 Tax=Streptomyces sp. NPDC006733 TaxID=3155460 RepID=UPI00340E7127